MAASVKVAVLIPCGDQIHRGVIHRDGTMTLAEHPSIDMLKAFTAFGAAPAPCLRRLEEWEGDPAAVLTRPWEDFILGDEVREMPLRELGMMTHDWAKHVLPLGTTGFPRLEVWLDLVAKVYQEPWTFTDTARDDLDLKDRAAHKWAGTPQPVVDSYIITTTRYAIRTARRWLNVYDATSDAIYNADIEAIAPDIRYLVMGTSSSGISTAQMTDEMGMLMGAKDAVARGHAEAAWQGKRAAEILHDYAEGKLWQPL
jgi:hypothetical protein